MTRLNRGIFEPMPEHVSGPVDRVMDDLATRLGIDPQIAQRRALVSALSEFAVNGVRLKAWLDRLDPEGSNARQSYADGLDLIQSAIREFQVKP